MRHVISATVAIHMTAAASETYIEVLWVLRELVNGHRDKLKIRKAVGMVH